MEMTVSVVRCGGNWAGTLELRRRWEGEGERPFLGGRLCPLTIYSATINRSGIMLTLTHSVRVCGVDAEGRSRSQWPRYFSTLPTLLTAISDALDSFLAVGRRERAAMRSPLPNSMSSVM